MRAGVLGLLVLGLLAAGGSARAQDDTPFWIGSGDTAAVFGTLFRNGGFTGQPSRDAVIEIRCVSGRVVGIFGSDVAEVQDWEQAVLSFAERGGRGMQARFDDPFADPERQMLLIPDKLMQIFHHAETLTIGQSAGDIEARDGVFVFALPPGRELLAGIEARCQP